MNVIVVEEPTKVINPKKRKMKYKESRCVVVIFEEPTKVQKVDKISPNAKRKLKTRHKPCKLRRHSKKFRSIPDAPHNTSSMIMDAHSTPTRSLDNECDLIDYSSDDCLHIYDGMNSYESDHDRDDSSEDST